MRIKAKIRKKNNIKNLKIYLKIIKIKQKIKKKKIIIIKIKNKKK